MHERLRFVAYLQLGMHLIITVHGLEIFSEYTLYLSRDI